MRLCNRGVGLNCGVVATARRKGEQGRVVLVGAVKAPLILKHGTRVECRVRYCAQLDILRTLAG